jgi:hypothetical protein
MANRGDVERGDARDLVLLPWGRLLRSADHWLKRSPPGGAARDRAGNRKLFL